MELVNESDALDVPGQLRKFCIFCGGKPAAKTREHVIPKWLIRLTGDENRVIPLSFDKNSGKLIHQSPISYTFPACDVCNNEYSKLEASAQATIHQLLSGGNSSELEVSILLDWFDKVRIGLWLGDMMRNPSSVQVKRKFHIDKRIGSSDRCLHIFKANDAQKGFAFVGTFFPLFHYMPSCFGLIINNLYFLNTSSGFLFGHRLGMPKLTDRYFDEETHFIGGELSRGRHSVRLPLVNFPIRHECVSIFQPCYGQFEASGEYSIAEVFDDYATQRMLIGFEKGKIFRGNGTAMFSGREKLNIMEGLVEYDREILHAEFFRYVLQFQTYLMRDVPSYDHWSKENRQHTRKLFKYLIRSNLEIIKAATGN